MLLPKRWMVLITVPYFPFVANNLITPQVSSSFFSWPTIVAMPNREETITPKKDAINRTNHPLFLKSCPPILCTYRYHVELRYSILLHRQRQRYPILLYQHGEAFPFWSPFSVLKQQGQVGVWQKPLPLLNPTSWAGVG